ncbi:MAG: peptidylprolyl isomerase [Candidatus Aenigmarchaeota archaeon]|nr:peptidylprolyl isomerase [Candidatus Aenigmarchaeota archaeon]
MIVANGDKVYVNYTGMLDDGTVFDSSDGKESLAFVVGDGSMIKGFDSGVVGMKTGQEKTIKIPAAEAYGEWTEDNVISVSLKTLSDAGITPKVGGTLYMSGQPVKVVEIAGNITRIDANHPLAGKDLTFRIKMIKIDR